VSGSDSARPVAPASLRIGVTGARRITASMQAHLSQQVRDLLAAIAGTTPAPSLRLLSPLARGADRIAARAAVDAGVALFVPMPFPQAAYETSFSGSDTDDEPRLSADDDVAAFRALLARAAGSVELDGDIAADAPGGYAAVGQFVVRHSDLLLALWDDAAERKKGGTAEILRYALRVGVPVIWLHAGTPQPPRWLAGTDSFDRLAEAPLAAERLAAWRDRLLCPPAPPRLRQPRHATLLDHAGDAVRWTDGLPGRIGRRLRGHPPPPAPSPLDLVRAETQRPVGGLWTTYDRLIRLAARERPGAAAPKADTPPPDAPQAWWQAWYARADALAVRHASRSRSVTALVLGLAAVAVALGGVGDALAALDGLPSWPARAALALQLLAIGAIMLLVAVARAGAWQERSVERRLLAELCRIQAALAPLARDLPLSVAAADRTSPLAWLFAALQRAAPLPTGRLTPDRLKVARAGLLRGLIGGQVHWHRARRRRMHRAGALLLHGGEALFFAVAVVIGVKLWLARRRGGMAGASASAG